MNAITYTAARAAFATTMDTVCDNHEPLIITRNGAQSVVMLSLEDYAAMEETLYLLRSPANAKRLLQSIAQIEQGQSTPRQLIEVDTSTPKVAPLRTTGFKRKARAKPARAIA